MGKTIAVGRNDEREIKTRKNVRKFLDCSLKISYNAI